MCSIDSVFLTRQLLQSGTGGTDPLKCSQVLVTFQTAIHTRIEIPSNYDSPGMKSDHGWIGDWIS